jgi:hypothetical protein
VRLSRDTQPLKILQSYTFPNRLCFLSSLVRCLIIYLPNRTDMVLISHSPLPSTSKCKRLPIALNQVDQLISLTCLGGLRIHFIDCEEKTLSGSAIFNPCRKKLWISRCFGAPIILIGVQTMPNLHLVSVCSIVRKPQLG